MSDGLCEWRGAAEGGGGEAEGAGGEFGELVEEGCGGRE